MGMFLFQDDFAETHEYRVNGKKFKSKKGSGKEGMHYELVPTFGNGIAF